MGSWVVIWIEQALFTRVIQIRDWCLPAPEVCVKEELNTGTAAVVLLVLALKPNNSVTPYMLLAPFKLLSLHWNLG